MKKTKTASAVIEPLGAHHDRAAFSCGDTGLDAYLEHRATQDERRNVARVFVLVGDGPSAIAGFYSVYHGPDGLKAIAQRVNTMTAALRAALAHLGHDVGEGPVFDTLRVRPDGKDAAVVLEKATELRINLRSFADGTLGVTLDETADASLLADLIVAFGGRDTDRLDASAGDAIPTALVRTSPYMTHPVFNTHRSETELLRYMKRLETATSRSPTR